MVNVAYTTTECKLVATPNNNDFPPLHHCTRTQTEQMDFIHVTGRPVKFQITPTRKHSIIQFGETFLGRIWCLDRNTDQWEAVHKRRPDIVVHIVNFREYFAFKQLNPNTGDDIANMITILQHIQPYKNPYIANLVDCLKDEEHFYIITEFGGEDLFNVLTDPIRNHFESEALIKIAFFQIVLALSFLQDAGIYHRNLNVESIMYDVTTGAVKVTGFGMATFVPCMTMAQIDAEMNRRNLGAQNPYPAMYSNAIGTELMIPLLIMPHESRGSRITVPPEMFAGHPIDGFKADMWALGVILFYILTGGPPWNQAQPSDEYFIRNTNYVGVMEDLAYSPLSPSAKEMLCLLVSSVDPALRPSVIEVLKHPWVAA